VIRSTVELTFEPEKDFGRLLDRALHPPLRDLRFWVVQVLVFAIAFLVWEAGHSDQLAFGIPSYVPVSLFVVPVVYAALNFGLAGSLATAGWTILLGSLLLEPTSHLYLWAEVTQFLIVVFVSIFVGDRVEREVLARQRAERAQAALRQLFETSPAPTVWLGEDGAMLEANPAALRLFQRAGPDALPTTLAELVGQEAAHDILSRHGSPIQVSANGAHRILRPITASWELAARSGVQVIFFDVSEEQRRADRADAYAAWVLRGQEEERQRIAKELHDEPVQSLVLLCRQLDVLSEDVEGNELRRRVGEVRRLAVSITEDLRRTSKGLRPPSLDDLGLTAAVRRLATDLEERQGIKVRLRVSGTAARLGGDAELGLFRIAQEALRNVERHSQASAVTISLSFSDRAVRLRIRDDGCGFDNSRDWALSGSLGLVGMQERAMLLGGELKVESQPDEGTTVNVVLPAPQHGVPALNGRGRAPNGRTA
jgi:signal transduction histidine kinase